MDTSTTVLEPLTEQHCAQPMLLVLDSDAGIRRFLADFLTQRGYRVLTTASHDEAARFLREEPITCLLAELRHEAWDLALLRELRALDPVGRVRTIVSALHVDRAVDREARRLGVNDYLPRPWSIEDLEETVARVVASSEHPPRWMDPRLDAERYGIWLRHATSRQFVLANANGETPRLPSAIESTDPRIQWLATHQEPGVITHEALGTTWGEAADYLVGLYAGTRLIGVVGLQDRFWRMWYEADGCLGFTELYHRLWRQAVEHFAYERLEDNHVDLALKVAALLAEPARERETLLTRTVPGVHTFVDDASLCALHASVETARAWYARQGYCYALGEDGPWPIALVAAWDAYQLLCAEGKSSPAALQELDAMSGLFLAPRAVAGVLQVLRHFPRPAAFP